MKLLIVSKFAWIAFTRRLARQVAAFPLLALFGMAGLVVAGIGLGELYRQTSGLLSILSEPLKYEVQYRLVSAITLLAFITYYIVIITILREPACDRSMLTAAPLEYGLLWLGTNSVALTLSLIGLVAITFPPMLAIVNLSPVALPPVLSWSGALMITVMLVARAGAAALWIWSLARFLKLKFQIFSKLGIFLEGGLVVFVGIGLGWPLAQTAIVVVDPAGYMLSRCFTEPSTRLAIEATVWLLGPAILSAIFAYTFLNRANEVAPTPTHESLLSRYVLFENTVEQFIACEIKRFLRQRTLLLGYAFPVSLLLLWAYSMQRFPGAQAAIPGLLIPIAPYLGLIFPLLTLHFDLPSDWVFRSVPLPRLTYLTLKLISAAIISGMTTAIVILGGTFGQWQIVPGLIWSLLSQTLGLTGIAFILGGVLRHSLGEAAGQVFAMFLLFIVGAALQYSIGASVPFLSVWGAGALWMLLFITAPFGVQAWETAIQQKS